jgi:hypothetical protein
VFGVIFKAELKPVMKDFEINRQKIEEGYFFDGTPSEKAK